MKILLVVTGVGFGDSIRVHTVINAFKKKHPDTKFLIGAYDNSYRYFKRYYPMIRIMGYKIPGKSMKFKVFPFLTRNFLLPLRWLITAFKMKRVVKKFKPDIVISDFEPVGAVLAKLMKKKCIMMFGYDPLLYKEYKEKNKVSKIMAAQATYLEQIYARGDHIIVPTLLGAKKRSMVYNYVNPITRAGPKNLLSKKTLMKKLKLDKEPIVVMLGGSGFGTQLLKQLHKVAKEFPEEKFVVFGARRSSNKVTNVEHHTFKVNVLEYLKVAKGLVTLGGECTLSEGITFRKPMLIYPIQEHIEQALNAYRLKDVAMLGKDVKNLKRDLKRFLKNLKLLQKRMDKLKVESNGAEEVIRLVKIFLK